MIRLQSKTLKYSGCFTVASCCGFLSLKPDQSCCKSPPYFIACLEKASLGLRFCVHSQSGVHWEAAQLGDHP